MKNSRFTRGLDVRAASDFETDLLLYDAIGWYAVSAQDFAEALAKIKTPTINVRINSPGGDIFDGFSIYNSLRNHGAKIITHIDGLAASAASIVAMAGTEIRMAGNSMMMIHEPWTITAGNADEHRKQAETLDKVSVGLIKTYVDRTGNSDAEVRAWLAAETWFTAQEALDNGFATSITGSEEDAAEPAVSNFAAYLERYRNTPERLKIAASVNDKGTADKWLSRAEYLNRKPANKREFESFLRDVGNFSNTEAKRIAAGFGESPVRDGRASDVASTIRDEWEFNQYAFRFKQMREKRST